MAKPNKLRVVYVVEEECLNSGSSSIVGICSTRKAANDLKNGGSKAYKNLKNKGNVATNSEMLLGRS